MDNEIKLKLATLDDLPAMIEVGDLLFDYSIKPDRASEFLNDPRHHLILAYDETDIVGMASGFHYIHPDRILCFLLMKLVSSMNSKVRALERH